MNDPNYLIWDSRKGPSDMAWFWRKDGKGYTSDIDDAGRYTFDQATSHRRTDIAVPLELAIKISQRCVLLDVLRQNASGLQKGKF